MKFEKSLQSCRGLDLDLAHRIEGFNAEFAAAVLRAVLQIEVPLRNTIDNTLREAAGTGREWFDLPDLLYGPGPRSQADAKNWEAIERYKRDHERGRARPKDKQERPRVRGDLIASMSLGFWVTLLRRVPLWERHLHKAFNGVEFRRGPWLRDAIDPASGQVLKPRSRLHHSILQLQIARNDAAHGRLVIAIHKSDFYEHLSVVAAAIDGELHENIVRLPPLPDPEFYGLWTIRHGHTHALRDVSTEPCCEAHAVPDLADQAPDVTPV